MLTTNLSLTFSLIWTLVIANVVAAALLFVLSRYLARLIFLPALLLVPAVTVFTLMGAWMSTFQLGDWYTLLAAGALGIAMKGAGWPRAPLILGFIIAPIIENALHISRQSYGMAWIGRPIVLILLAVAVATVVLSVRRSFKQRAAARTGTRGADSFADPEPTDQPWSGASRLGFAFFVTALFAYALWEARTWPAALAAFPVVVAVPGIACSLIAVAGEWSRRHGSVPRSDWSGGRAVLEFGVWMALIIAATLLVGQLVALPLFTLLFLVARARVRPLLATAYAAGVALLLWGVFDQIIHVTWYRAWLI